MENRIEQALDAALSLSEGQGCPPMLAEALRYAVFPGGQRLRPRLSLAVAAACGSDDLDGAAAAAAAIELLHCASLVHDDLPCFDDAATRRGRPSVHRQFGERIAVLVGDALIVLAFEWVGRNVAPTRIGPIVTLLGHAVGAPSGLCAGQAWECEPSVDLELYHRQKTGALFAAATAVGAASAGLDPSRWGRLGELLGEAYQVADDIRDVAASAEETGKPAGQDVALDRPSAARSLGIEGAIARLDGLVAAAVESIPPCSGAPRLAALIGKEAERFLPANLIRHAA